MHSILSAPVVFKRLGGMWKSGIRFPHFISNLKGYILLIIYVIYQLIYLGEIRYFKGNYHPIMCLNQRVYICSWVHVGYSMSSFVKCTTIHVYLPLKQLSPHVPNILSHLRMC